MQEIGLKLKTKREENGVSIEEAAEDLKMRPSQIQNIEEGNLKEFKDVFYLKYFIRDYAKYLGIDSDKIVDEFNEFLFDYTSKIPVQAIEEAKNSKKNEKKDFISPYTKVSNKKFVIPKVYIYVFAGIMLILIGYLLFNFVFRDNNFKKNDNITYIEMR